MNKKAFTLIELLGVILLLGIIISIAVGSYSVYLNNSKNKAFKIAESSFITATKDAYADCVSNNRNNEFCSNHKELNTEYEYELIYLKELVDDNYIEKIKNPYDTEQFCDIDKSYVYVSSKNNTEESNNSDIVYKACLVCGDHKSVNCLDENLDYSTFDTTCEAHYDSVNGQVYDGEWTDRNIYLSFGASGNYRYGIDYFIYTYNGSSTKIIANRSNNTASLILDKSIKNFEYTVQAFDGTSGKGTIVSCGKNIKIDKGTINSVNITAKNTSGTTVTSNNWSDTNVTLTANVNPSTSVSGYLYQWYKDGEKYGSQTSSSTLTVSAKGTYKVEVTNQVGKIVKTSNDFIVKIDTKKPTCTLVASGDKYNDVYTSDVTISFSSVSDKETDNSDGSGIKSKTIDISTITTDVSKQVVTGTVVDNVGRSNTCTIEITKDTKTPTIVASEETNYITTSTNKSISSYFVDSFGVSSGTTVCKVGTKTVTNTNDLQLGVNTVTCTSTGNNGKTDSAQTTFRHQYTAIGSCSNGGTLVDNSSCYYASNAFICGTSQSCSTTCADAGTECVLWRCYLINYNSCHSTTYSSCNSSSGFPNYYVNSVGESKCCATKEVKEEVLSSCANAKSKECIEQKTIQNCSNNCTTISNSCNKTDSDYLTYTCPTTGIDSNTNTTVNATVSDATCSF